MLFYFVAWYPTTPAAVAAGGARQRKRGPRNCAFYLVLLASESDVRHSRACCSFALVLLAALQPSCSLQGAFFPKALCSLPGAFFSRLPGAFKKVFLWLQKATVRTSFLQKLPRALKRCPQPLSRACCSFALVLPAAFKLFSACQARSLAVFQAPSKKVC